MLRYKEISASTVSSSGAAAGGVSVAVPSATAYDQPSSELTCSEARGSRRRLRVFARGSVPDTWMAAVRASKWYDTFDSCGRPSRLRVASTPRELSAITASSLSSNTWRPMGQAYSDGHTPLGIRVASIAL